MRDHENLYMGGLKRKRYWAWSLAGPAKESRPYVRLAQEQYAVIIAECRLNDATLCICCVYAVHPPT